MRCPTLSELPLPPAGKIGWPWTEESPQLPDTLPDGTLWPRVSIVTPSYNQAQFIEETIRSVLLQGYPDLEYIIMDGGSTDGSVEIIRKYASWLAYWVSEKDRGQSHAINKGWTRSTGKIIAWLNSDDLYERSAFPWVVQSFAEYPDAVVVYGKLSIFRQGGEVESVIGGGFSEYKLVRFWQGHPGISQPSSFFQKRLLTEIGWINECLHYLMDYEYFLRAITAGSFHYVDQILARFRLQDDSKTSSGWYRFIREYVGVANAYAQAGGKDAYPGLVSDVRRHYASLLVSSILEHRSVDGRSNLSVLVEALRYDLTLLKQRWMLKLVVKTLLGPQLTAILQALRSQSERRY